MAEAKSNKQYVNGIFVTKREGAYGEFFSLGLKKDDVLRNIEALEADDKGFVNLTMTPQKSDGNKYSVYVNDWKPQTQVPSKANNGGKTKPKADSTDDLPF